MIAVMTDAANSILAFLMSPGEVLVVVIAVAILFFLAGRTSKKK